MVFVTEREGARYNGKRGMELSLLLEEEPKKLYY